MSSSSSLEQCMSDLLEALEEAMPAPLTGSSTSVSNTTNTGGETVDDLMDEYLSALGKLRKLDAPSTAGTTTIQSVVPPPSSAADAPAGAAPAPLEATLTALVRALHANGDRDEWPNKPEQVPWEALVASQREEWESEAEQRSASAAKEGYGTASVDGARGDRVVDSRSDHSSLEGLVAQYMSELRSAKSAKEGGESQAAVIARQANDSSSVGSSQEASSTAMRDVQAEVAALLEDDEVSVELVVHRR